MNGPCYDNIWADMVLNGGNKPKGIYGYVDIFTMKGLLKVIAFGLVYNYVDQFLKTTFAGFWMALVVYMTPDIKICKPGEFVYWGWDVCVSLLGGSDEESGLKGFWEARKEEIAEDSAAVDEGALVTEE